MKKMMMIITVPDDFQINQCHRCPLFDYVDDFGNRSCCGGKCTDGMECPLQEFNREGQQQENKGKLAVIEKKLEHHAIAITYGEDNTRTYLITSETEDYVYFDGQCAADEKYRFVRTKRCIEFHCRSGEWQETRDTQSITNVNIY